VKADDAAQSEDATDKDVVSFVELDASRVAAVMHCIHGVTPARSSNSRTSSTWYRFASFPG
jgi:hypothetical protein